MNEKKVRKKYIIDKKFQFRMIGTLITSILVAFILFTAISALYYWAVSSAGDNVFKEYITLHKQVVEKRIVERDGKTVQEEYSYTKDVPGVKRWEIIIPPILINNLIILIVILIIGILYSHKIAGPVHRIKTDIQKVISGKRDIRILLRKKDKLQELADSVNLLIEKFEQFKEESDK